MAPLIPSAKYSWGFTILPVWPICWLYGIQPEIDRRPGCSDDPSHRLGELLDQREALGPADAPPAGDDDLRLLDRCRGGRLGDPLHDLDGRLLEGLFRNVGLHGPGCIRGLRGHHVRPDRDDASVGGEAARRRQLAAEDAHLDHRGTVRPGDRDGVAENAPARQRGQRPRQVPAVRPRADELELAHVVTHDVSDPFGRDHRPRPVRRRRFGDRQDTRQVAGKLAGRRLRIGRDDDP